MSPFSEQIVREIVYRRVAPKQWDRTTGTVKQELFDLRCNLEGIYESGLSVYDASVISPRGVLQILIDNCSERTKLSGSEGEKAKRRLAEIADVEALWKEGWRLIKIPVREFTKREFWLGPNDAIGHLEIRGHPRSSTDLEPVDVVHFRRHRQSFVELVDDGIAPFLSREECLLR